MQNVADYPPSCHTKHNGNIISALSLQSPMLNVYVSALLKVISTVEPSIQQRRTKESVLGLHYSESY